MSYQEGVEDRLGGMVGETNWASDVAASKEV